jgi:hypothetical protein
MIIDSKYKLEVCCSKDAFRTALTQPYFDADRSRLLATDGHVLAAIPVTKSSDDEKSCFISGKALHEGRKYVKRWEPVEVLHGCSLPNGLTLPSPDQSEKFPEVDQVIPRFKYGDEGTCTITFDADLLRLLTQALGTSKVCLTWQVDEAAPHRSPMTPILVTPNESGAKELGVLMPMGHY